MKVLSPKLRRRLLKLIGKSLLIFVLASSTIIFILRWIPLPTSSFMLQQKFHNLLANNHQTVRYKWVNYKNISPYVAIAVIAEEDQNFPFHFGFDFGQIKKAIAAHEDGRRLRGASTISQQVAKNLFLWSGRSYFRKALEAYITILLELIWGKQRILEVYLNIAQMGKGVFGVQAAAHIYFHESAKHLTRYQAAALAAVLPNPDRYSVTHPSAYIKHRRRWILRQMRSLGGVRYLRQLS